MTGCVASAFQAIAFESLDLGLSTASIVINQVGECVSERERECVCVSMCENLCLREKERVCVSMCASVCVREREWVCQFLCQCVCERERMSVSMCARGCVNVWMCA